MTIKNVMLAGAGGTIGSYILQGLVDGGFNITILSRQSSKAQFPGHNVVTVGDEYPHDEMVAAFKGQDAVVSALTIAPGGKIDSSDQLRLVDAAIEAGVQRFIPSEYGHDHRNNKAVEFSALVEAKFKVVEYLKSKVGKIEYTVVPTGPFYDFDLKIGFCGIDLKKGKVTLTDGGNNPYSVTTMKQVGEGVAAVLKHDKETANKHVPIESFSTTQNKNVAAVQKCGRALTTEHQRGEDLIANSRAGIAAGSLWAHYGLLQAMLFIPGYGADYSVEAEKWRAILGLEKLDLQKETERVLAELEAQGEI